MITALLTYTPQILQLLLFLIMLGMGMTLTASDFLRIRQYPRAVAVGLCNQIVLLPLVGFLIVALVPMRPEFAMGLIVVTACPGGATSNLITHLAKGDTALSITLTAFSSLITILTVPMVINLGLQWLLPDSEAAVRLAFLPTVFNIVKLTALPVVFGMLINARFPSFALRSRSVLAWSSGVFILIALGLMVSKLAEIGRVGQFIVAVGLGVILLNLSTLTLGFWSARLLRLNVPQAITISIETGMQNNVLGMAIALSPSMLDAPLMAASAGVYGIVMCATGLLLISAFRRLVGAQPITDPIRIE